MEQVDLEKVRRARELWLENNEGALLDLSPEERSVTLVSVGYDQPEHASLVGIPPEHLGPARALVARTLLEGGL